MLMTPEHIRHWVPPVTRGWYGRFLSVSLMIERVRRAGEIRDDNDKIDAGYCIDAPSHMPAGGCFVEPESKLADDITLPACAWQHVVVRSGDEKVEG